jgi:hypothetical protein
MEKYPDQKEWSDIKGYEERYEMRMIEVEPYCEIRSKTKFKKNLKQYMDDGYPCVNLYEDPKSNSKRKKVHRLIGLQYMPNPDGKETINHINGIKTDNRMENLEWNTSEENYKHARDNDLLKLYQNGERHVQFLGAIEMYDNGKLLKVMRGKREIRNEGLNDSKVYECVNGKRESYMGYTFKRLEISL